MDKMKQKFLLLTEYFPESENAEITGGVENRCFNIVKFLSSKYDVKVICSRQQGQIKHSSVFGCDVFRVGPEISYSSKGDLIKRFMFAYSAYKLAKKQKDVDLIEAESFLTYLPTYFAGKKIKAKKTATWHETWVGEWIKNKGFVTGLFGEIWERFSIKLNWDMVISVSNFTKERLLERKIKCKNIKVIPNGIDFDKIEQVKISHSDEVGKIKRICVVGRLTPMKRVDIIINAFSKLIKETPRLELNIVGSGPELENLKKIVNNLNLSEKIIFHGFIEKYEDVIKIMKSSDFYVSASELEGFGITVLEAMACNLPVILSDIKPFREISENKAIFFEDVNQLYKALNFIMAHNELNKEQLKKQSKLLSKYHWDEIIKKGYDLC